MEIDFAKYSDGLVPAIVQDAETGKVLMLGFMNQEAIDTTQSLGKVSFYSRSKRRIWTKGEESGNFLMLKGLAVDCDRDTLLVRATPLGPVCHTGADTCWNEENKKAGSTSAAPADRNGPAFLTELSAIIKGRKINPEPNSYISGLFQKGINKIAQKLGEEAVETVIEAKDQDQNLFLNEAADLLFHYLILLEAKGHNLEDVTRVLELRHDKSRS